MKMIHIAIAAILIPGIAWGSTAGYKGFSAWQEEQKEQAHIARMEEILSLHRDRFQALLDLKSSRPDDPAECNEPFEKWTRLDDSIRAFYEQDPETSTDLTIYLQDRALINNIDFMVAHGFRERPEVVRDRNARQREIEQLAIALGVPDSPLVDPNNRSSIFFGKNCVELMMGDR